MLRSIEYIVGELLGCLNQVWSEEELIESIETASGEKKDSLCFI